jgi:hypothetical protein
MKQCEKCLERRFRFVENDTKSICLSCGNVRKLPRGITFCRKCGKQFSNCGIKNHKKKCKG